MNDETQNNAGGKTDKPPYDWQNVESHYHEQNEEVFSAFGDDYVPVDGPLTMLGVADSLLKHPARATYEIMEGRFFTAGSAFLGIILLCMAATGVVMGSFAGGTQYWIVPAKLLIGMLFSGLICLPSLYIFTTLSGSRQSIGQTAGLFLQALALTGILLVGFAPIVWIFSQATETTVFMGVMHIIFWIISIWFGLRLLKAAFTHLGNCSMAALKTWSLIFFVVLLQMSTALRPLIGKDDGVWPKQKKFFLTHWSDCMKDPRP